MANNSEVVGYKCFDCKYSNCYEEECSECSNYSVEEGACGCNCLKESEDGESCKYFKPAEESTSAQDNT